ncbi:MAG TPA: FAD-dependent oxidoreductase [Edaphobacter sp.]
MQRPDICIAGAGIIGISLALELHHRGARVTVLDRSAPFSEASTAAAGMLAARDPHNPPQLSPLSHLSLSLYPAFLDRLQSLSGHQVPFHTSITLQSVAPSTQTNLLTPEDLAHLLPPLNARNQNFLLLDEHSLDPHQIAAALLAAVAATSIDLRPHTPVRLIRSISSNTVEVHTATSAMHAGQFVDCTGAWSTASISPTPLPITPRKGQMLAVILPPSLKLTLAVRTPEIYIVPRTTGPHAGRAIIGATVEDAGFDKTVHPADIDRLHKLATNLLPILALAPQLEAWAGLRPATPDGLPLLGAVPGQQNHFIATGHYRNGILLAPATAHLMAQLLSGEQTSIDLSPYSPNRTA